METDVNDSRFVCIPLSRRAVQLEIFTSTGQRSKFTDWQHDLAGVEVVGGSTAQPLDQREQIACQQACLPN